MAMTIRFIQKANIGNATTKGFAPGEIEIRDAHGRVLLRTHARLDTFRVIRQLIDNQQYERAVSLLARLEAES